METTKRERSDYRGTQIDASVFIGLVFALSLALYLPILLRARPVAQQPILVILLMWTPAIAAALARLRLAARPRSTSRPQSTSRPRFAGKTGAPHILSLGGRRRRSSTLAAIGAAILLPVVTASIAYGVAWSTGLADFVVPRSGVDPRWSLIGSVLRAMTLGTVLGIPIVAGEELGWRAFLGRRLQRLGVPHSSLVGGIVWTAWHTPLILSGQYAGGPHPVISVAAFGILAISLHSLWMEQLRRTGSLWPAILGHSAWNTVVQFPFAQHTAGDNAALWVGDSGVIVVLVCAALCGVYIAASRRKRTVK